MVSCSGLRPWTEYKRMRGESGPCTQMPLSLFPDWGTMSPPATTPESNGQKENLPFLSCFCHILWCQQQGKWPTHPLSSPHPPTCKLYVPSSDSSDFGHFTQSLVHSRCSMCANYCNKKQSSCLQKKKDGEAKYISYLKQTSQAHADFKTWFRRWYKFYAQSQTAQYGPCLCLKTRLLDLVILDPSNRRGREFQDHRVRGRSKGSGSSAYKPRDCFPAWPQENWKGSAVSWQNAEYQDGSIFGDFPRSNCFIGLRHPGTEGDCSVIECLPGITV